MDIEKRKCVSGQYRSPVACGGFGYCREEGAKLTDGFVRDGFSRQEALRRTSVLLAKFPERKRPVK